MIITYDISGGELFFYSPADLHFVAMQGAVRMKDKVDRDDLQRVVRSSAPHSAPAARW